MDKNSTVCAISSPAGVGAIAIIRITGKDSFKIAAGILNTENPFPKIKRATVNYAQIKDVSDNIIDTVLFTKFFAPKSFTGEDMIEIYCHGSEYIQKSIIEIICDNGAEIAQPGEFTKRAFLNGKIDLSQSEAVADIISSNSMESHRLAMNQIKGKVSDEINALRDKLLELVSLMELELDFSEEDIEFADRKEINNLIKKLSSKIEMLIDSFKYGNAVKSGVPVVIAGKPNVGKSSLLNILLQEEKAIVSEIPGTTRDAIEDEITIEGIRFRFTDTAGIRESGDEIESIGIKKTYEKLSKALIILLMTEAGDNESTKEKNLNFLQSKISKEQKIIIVVNKIDKVKNKNFKPEINNYPQIGISATQYINIDELKKILVSTVKSLKSENQEIIITGVRHEQALKKCKESLIKALKSLNNNLSGDFVSQDIREAVYYLGEITGKITNEEVLGAIFERFCIGK